MATVIRSLGITGISGCPLAVEVAIITGLQTTNIVGLGDNTIKVAKERLLSEKHQADKRAMLVAGSSSSLVRDLRSEFVQLAIADGHALKDIASFLHVSHETVRRIGKGR
ncbi:hypothetical protein SDC9_60683 [bioreactor metagenome]|uniref:Uncharacterized protein n=1 Tax=bioreactor metagenome TaxID=1076179 RepID=A0A644XEX7_9ZZZZ